MTVDQLTDALDCGSPREIYEHTIAQLRFRAAQARDIARGLKRDAQDALEQAEGHLTAAKEFDDLATAIERSSITFPASGLQPASPTAEGGDAQNTSREGS